MAVVQHLQQNIEHIRVSLLNLIKKDHAVRVPAHLLTELSALIIANIPWRGTDQLGDAVLLHIFRHVHTDHCLLASKHSLGKRLGKLGFTNAGGAKE